MQKSCNYQYVAMGYSVEVMAHFARNWHAAAIVAIHIRQACIFCLCVCGAGYRYLLMSSMSTQTRAGIACSVGLHNACMVLRVLPCPGIALYAKVLCSSSCTVLAVLAR